MGNLIAITVTAATLALGLQSVAREGGMLQKGKSQAIVATPTPAASPTVDPSPPAKAITQSGVKRADDPAGRSINKPGIPVRSCAPKCKDAKPK